MRDASHPGTGKDRLRWRPRRSWGIAVYLCLLVGLDAFPAQFTRTADSVLEYKVKAAFLFNFAKFTEWPADKLPTGAPLRIGIAGGEIRAIVAESLKDKRAGEHPLEFIELATPEQAAACHLVFLPRSAALPAESLAAALDGQPVLIVGETEGFAARHGMIGLVIRGENVRFQVNLAAAQRAGLKLSARLAALAELVKSASP